MPVVLVAVPSHGISLSAVYASLFGGTEATGLIALVAAL